MSCLDLWCFITFGAYLSGFRLMILIWILIILFFPLVKKFYSIYYSRIDNLKFSVHIFAKIIDHYTEWYHISYLNSISRCLPSSLWHAYLSWCQKVFCVAEIMSYNEIYVNYISRHVYDDVQLDICVILLQQCLKRTDAMRNVKDILYSIRAIPNTI